VRGYCGKRQDTLNSYSLTVDKLSFLLGHGKSPVVFSCDMVTSSLEKRAAQVSQMADAVRAVLQRKD